MAKKFEKGDRVVVNDKCPKWLGYRGLHGKVLGYVVGEQALDNRYGVMFDNGDGDHLPARELDREG